jgi:mannosyl-3-phosphoglycerate phosphatase family protein
MSTFVFFTDLDGTLLDHDTYSYEAARPALRLLKKSKTPLILVSSKTRREMEAFRTEFGNTDPFIVENGGSIFIPESSRLHIPPQAAKTDGYRIITLGLPADDIRPSFQKLAKQFPVRSLSDMPVTEIVRLTGLNPQQARTARQREFGEVFIFEDSQWDRPAFDRAVTALGLTWTEGGRFYHLMGTNDKGKAVEILSGLYRKTIPDLVTAACGDAPNDRPMLAAVDRPFLVAGPDGTHRAVDLPGLTKVSGSGPQGFTEAVFLVISEGN